MSTRPRTTDDLAELPIGPAFGMTTREIDGRTVRVPVMMPVEAFWSEDEDILGYTDSDGQRWTLGRYTTGEWFRRRADGA